VLNAARLVAEKLERGGYGPGYDWCCVQLRQAGLARLANEVELAKASRHLAAMDFGAAIAVYKVGRWLEAGAGARGLARQAAAARHHSLRFEPLPHPFLPCRPSSGASRASRRAPPPA
jgi:hypothetical protein